MELVVNDEPVTIKITIEVIPSKKKEDVKEETVVVKPPNVIPKTPTVTTVDIDTKPAPEGWDAIEPDIPPVVPPVEPVTAPEKKKRAYTRKVKTTEEVVKEERVAEKKLAEETPIVPTVTTQSYTSAPTTNKVVARLAQMIRFYCKASNIPTTEITKKYLVDHGAADIIEGATDEDIEEAFKEVVKT